MFHVLMLAASAAPLTELHAETLREHPGTLVSVCRSEGEPDMVQRVVRTPSGQRSWRGDAPPVTEALDTSWGYGSIFHESIQDDPRWQTNPASPPEVRPVPGRLEALPPPAEVPEFGCVHTALPEAPRWLRVVTTEGRIEVLGRPPAFPADHGLGPPIGTTTPPSMLEVWVTAREPWLFRRLSFAVEYQFQGPDYPFSHHPFVADWDDLERVWRVLGAPATRALGRAYFGDPLETTPVYVVRAEAPDTLWAELGRRGDGALLCLFGPQDGFLHPCQDWHLARVGDWIAVSADPDALSALEAGDAAWWTDPEDKAIYRRLDPDPYGEVRITAADGWWTVTAHTQSRR